MMKANLELNLDESLSRQDLQELSEFAAQEQKTIDRVVTEATLDLVRKIRSKSGPQPLVKEAVA